MKSAQSRSELDLISRDLDQLEGALGTSQPAAPDPVPPRLRPRSGVLGWGAGLVVSGSRRALVVAFVAVVVAVVAGGGFGLAGLFRHGDSSSTPRALPPARTEGVDASDAPCRGSVRRRRVVGSAEYGLTAKGLTGFLATYATRFGRRAPSSWSLPTTPWWRSPSGAGRDARPGGSPVRRPAGRASGDDRGLPGQLHLDTRQIDVAALVRNLARPVPPEGRAPQPDLLMVRYIATFDAAPSIDIYITNRFNVRLPRDPPRRLGRRAYPFAVSPFAGRRV